MEMGTARFSMEQNQEHEQLQESLRDCFRYSFLLVNILDAIPRQHGLHALMTASKVTDLFL